MSLLSLITLFLFVQPVFASDSVRYSARLNGDGVPGKIDLSFDLRVESGPGVTFDDLLAAVKDVDMANDVSNKLMADKKFPLNFLKSKVELEPITPTEPGTGYTYRYVVSGFLDVMLMRGVTKKTSILKCKDSVVGVPGARKWSFGCEIELDPKKGQDGPEYFTSYSQPLTDKNGHADNYCLEEGSALVCHLHTVAELKPVKVPFAAQAFVGTKAFSPSQAGHKFVESLLHSYFVIHELVRLPKPYSKQVSNAVKLFKKSPQKKDLDQWLESYPEKSDDTKLILLSN